MGQYLMARSGLQTENTAPWAASHSLTWLDLTEVVDNVFLVARVMYKAVLGLHFQRQQQKKKNGGEWSSHPCPSHGRSQQRIIPVDEGRVSS